MLSAVPSVAAVRCLSGLCGSFIHCRLHSVRSFPLTTHPSLRNCAAHAHPAIPQCGLIPPPSWFAPFHFHAISAIVHFSRPHPRRLLRVSPPPAGRPVLYYFLALRAVWHSAASGCLRLPSKLRDRSRPPRPGRHGGGGGRSTHPVVMLPPSCVTLPPSDFAVALRAHRYLLVRAGAALSTPLWPGYTRC